MWVEAAEGGDVRQAKWATHQSCEMGVQTGQKVGRQVWRDGEGVVGVEHRRHRGTLQQRPVTLRTIL
jgi:hypothetical protein